MDIKPAAIRFRRASWPRSRMTKPPYVDAEDVVSAYVALVSTGTSQLPGRWPTSRLGSSWVEKASRTVDKFQGQEAAIVIFSPASSSAEEAPRGMEFLYSPNRLNVATSRARCLAVIVGSPKLFGPHCRSVRQMKLANGFCRFAEMARGD